MSPLSAALTLIITLILSVGVTIFWSVPIIAGGLIKLLLPFAVVKRRIAAFCNQMMYYWCQSLALLLRSNRHLRWEVQGLERLSKKHWYLLICNHRSWADIVVLSVLFHRHIPVNKYFLKQQLAWMPFLGLACWALDMPFMRRYSRSYLLRHPQRRAKDVETTRRSCEKFRHQPTTIVNFVEGSRFTEQKRRLTGSPYQHLLAPKAAGIAMALSVLGKQFDKLLDVTLCYPENSVTPFRDMLTGRLTRIVVSIKLLPVDPGLRGDYLHDKRFKRHFQRWLAALWREKDQQLMSVQQQYRTPD